MLANLLNVATDTISDVPAEQLPCVWSVFTKVKESVKDGRRLENLSWRLWYSEMNAYNRHRTTDESPFLHSPPIEQPDLSADTATESEPEEATTDVEEPSPSSSFTSAADQQQTTAVAPSTTTPQSPRRPSRSSSKRRRHRCSHPLPSNHPDSGRELLRPAVHDRANSTPSHHHTSPVRARRPSSFNLGKLITSPLPELQNLQPTPSAVDVKETLPAPAVTVEIPTLPPQLQVPAPSVVVLQPTPRPTPPESPVVPSRRPELQRSMDGLIKRTELLVPTLTEHRDDSPETTSSGPGPPVGPVPVDDCRKKKTFFFKESPSGGDDGAASSSSTSSAVKTPVPPTPVDRADDAHVDVLDPAPVARPSRVTTAVPRKGKEPMRQVTLARPAAVRQVVFGHGRGGKTAAHQRHYSTQTTGATSRAAPPTRSKSTAVMPTVQPVVGPSELRRSTSSSKLPPPSAVSSTKTIVAPTSPRVASPDVAAPAPSPVQQRSRPQPPKPTVDAPMPTTQAEKSKPGRMDAITSSDFETSDTEGEDSSWASDYSDDDEPETGNIAKEAAHEAARQLDMFAKVPTRSYTDLAKQPKAGLLSTLFHPDPALIPHIANPNAFRAHNSAMNLGARPVAPANVQALTSKSTAAVPLSAQVTVTQTQVGVNTSGRPGYRLKGKPENLEVESSDEEDTEDAVPLSKSVAQRKLEQLAGVSRKKLQQRTPPRPLQMTRTDESSSETLPQHAISGDGAFPDTSAPIVLPHPYNLPAPAPITTPRTTRREMLSTEMSESMRRQILWERETNRRIWQRSNSTLNTAVTQRSTSGTQQQRKPPVSVYGNDAYHAAGW